MVGGEFEIRACNTYCKEYSKTTFRKMFLKQKINVSLGQLLDKCFHAKYQDG